VVIDEAGQLDEPSSLGVLALAPRFVLGGDHLQLPPVVQGTTGETDEPYALERSLFERLALGGNSSSISRLRTQYRMSKEIQELPSRLFYDGTLEPAPEVAHRRLRISQGLSEDAWMNKALDPDRPVVFLDVKGLNAGRARPEEARLQQDCRRLIAWIPAQEIGVIPYRVSRPDSRRLPQGRRGTLSSVDTVDRFQGGEREVIILSWPALTVSPLFCGQETPNVS
jgi:DNA replication ATP-dependent helicase Dna2